MKVGKTILGIDAMEIIARTAPNADEVRMHFANLAMQAIESKKQEIGEEAGVTFRGMYVEEMNFVGRPNLTGYLLDFKLGPATPCDDQSKYSYWHFFAELDSAGKLVQVHEINNYPEQEP